MSPCKPWSGGVTPHQSLSLSFQLAYLGLHSSTGKASQETLRSPTSPSNKGILNAWGNSPHRPSFSHSDIWVMPLWAGITSRLCTWCYNCTNQQNRSKRMRDAFVPQCCVNVRSFTPEVTNAKVRFFKKKNYQKQCFHFQIQLKPNCGKIWGLYWANACSDSWRWPQGFSAHPERMRWGRPSMSQPHFFLNLETSNCLFLTLNAQQTTSPEQLSPSFCLEI